MMTILEIKERYLGGESIEQMARQIHVRTTKIYELLRKNGINLAIWKKEGRISRVFAGKIEDINDLKKMYESGLSCRKISEKIGVSDDVIRRTLKYILGMDIGEFNRKGYRKHGPIKDSGGYRKILKPDHIRADHRGYVLEHILVWEEANNKPVPDGYHIHHLNGIRNDNRPRNLMAVTPGEHHRLRIPYQKRIRELEAEIVQLKQIPLISNA